MTETRTNTYEGMFLFPQSATANLQAAVDHVKQILNRAEARIISFRKWDERRLAYEIKGNKRGVYFLAYFEAPAEKIRGIERDCNLSEQILRSMVIRADQVRQEHIEAADGQAELADEIRLRSEQKTTSESTGSSSVTTAAEKQAAAEKAEAAAAEEARKVEEARKAEPEQRPAADPEEAPAGSKS